MALDVAAIRAHVPALKSGTARFDAPGGTQTPQPVIDAIAAALTAPLANRGRNTEGERNADRIVDEARSALADLLGTTPGTVVFGRSATQLAYDLSRTLAKGWGPGDEVVVTRLDHDSNIRPWVQAAEAAGADVRWADFDPATGELRPEHLAAVLGPRTRLVAVTAASNLIGTMPDLPALASLVHANGAHFHVDAVHYASHAVVDLAATGADTLVCSPYKFLGPHLGVLTGRAELLESLRPDKLLPSADTVPERFELGTLPYELLAGTSAAVDFWRGSKRRPKVLAGTGWSPRSPHWRRTRRRCASASNEGSRSWAGSPCTRGRHGAPRRCCSPWRACARPTSTGSSPSGRSTRLPVPSTPWRPRAGWASVTRAAYVWASLRTAARRTWTGC